MDKYRFLEDLQKIYRRATLPKMLMIFGVLLVLGIAFFISLFSAKTMTWYSYILVLVFLMVYILLRVTIKKNVANQNHIIGLLQHGELSGYKTIIFNGKKTIQITSNEQIEYQLPPMRSEDYFKVWQFLKNNYPNLEK